MIVSAFAGCDIAEVRPVEFCQKSILQSAGRQAGNLSEFISAVRRNLFYLSLSNVSLSRRKRAEKVILNLIRMKKKPFDIDFTNIANSLEWKRKLRSDRLQSIYRPMKQPRARKAARFLGVGMEMKKLIQLIPKNHKIYHTIRINNVRRIKNRDGCLSNRSDSRWRK
jgi:hypothetical protein